MNVTPITAEQLKKLSDNQYKMVKVITDWERSGSGSGMARNLFQGQSDGDNNSTGNSENQHTLYLWYLAYKYDILNAMRQQLRNEFTADGSSIPDVRSV